MATQSLKTMVQQEAYRIVLLQLTGVAAISLLSLILAGKTSGFSALLGGLAYGLPNLVFVWRVFKFSGASQMVQFMAAFFIGEMLKLALSAILFLLIVKYLPISLLSVLVGYIAGIVSFWIASLWHFSNKAGTKHV